jgi:hypothetical protein
MGENHMRKSHLNSKVFFLLSIFFPCLFSSYCLYGDLGMTGNSPPSPSITVITQTTKGLTIAENVFGNILDTAIETEDLVFDDDAKTITINTDGLYSASYFAFCHPLTSSQSTFEGKVSIMVNGQEKTFTSLSPYVNSSEEFLEKTYFVSAVKSISLYSGDVVSFQGMANCGINLDSKSTFETANRSAFFSLTRVGEPPAPN